MKYVPVTLPNFIFINDVLTVIKVLLLMKVERINFQLTNTLVDERFAKDRNKARDVPIDMLMIYILLNHNKSQHIQSLSHRHYIIIFNM